MRRWNERARARRDDVEPAQSVDKQTSFSKTTTTRCLIAQRMLGRVRDGNSCSTRERGPLVR